MFSRLLGLVITAVGFWFFKAEFLVPLHKAQNHDLNFTYDANVAAIGMVIMLVGLSAILIGDKGVMALSNTKKSGRQTIAILLLAVVGTLPIFWLENRLESLGYKQISKEELQDQQNEERNLHMYDSMNVRRPFNRPHNSSP